MGTLHFTQNEVITKVNTLIKKPFRSHDEWAAWGTRGKGQRRAFSTHGLPPNQTSTHGLPPNQSLSEEQNYSFELHTQSGGCVAHQGRGLTSQKPSGWFSQ